MNIPLAIAVLGDTYIPPHCAFVFMNPTTVKVHAVGAPWRKKVTRTWNGWKVLSVGLMPLMSAGPGGLLSRPDSLVVGYPPLPPTPVPPPPPPPQPPPPRPNAHPLVP